MKKAISIILALVLMVSVVPYASAETKCGMASLMAPKTGETCNNSALKRLMRANAFFVTTNFCLLPSDG